MLLPRQSLILNKDWKNVSLLPPPTHQIEKYFSHQLVLFHGYGYKIVKITHALGKNLYSNILLEAIQFLSLYAIILPDF
jgi:hypothetical protein